MAGYIGSKVAVVSSGAERKKVFTATSGQTSFTGLSYTVNNVHVFQNGVRLVDGTDYTATNGNSITLTVGAATDDQVVVVSYNTFQTSDTVSASTGGTFSNAVTIDADGATVLTVDRATSDGTIIDLQKSGSSVGSIGVADSGDRIYLAGGGLEGVGIDNGANAFVPTSETGAYKDNHMTLGRSDARFTDLYLSGGVYLGGTGSANKLDDYEEGTWTPSLSFASGSIGYAWNLGQYTKVGNQVSVNFAFSVNSISSPSGDIFLAGLPFAAGSGEQYVSSITFGLIRGLTVDQKTVRGYVGNAQTTAPITVNATNTGYSGLNANTLTTSTFLYGSIVYQTT